MGVCVNLIYSIFWARVTCIINHPRVGSISSIFGLLLKETLYTVILHLFHIVGQKSTKVTKPTYSLTINLCESSFGLLSALNFLTASWARFTENLIWPHY